MTKVFMLTSHSLQPVGQHELRADLMAGNKQNAGAVTPATHINPAIGVVARTAIIPIQPPRERK